MIIGGKYFITFDKRHYAFQGSCTYLLANDFVDHNFTLLMSYDEQTENNELVIVLEKAIIRVNLKKNVSILILNQFVIGNKYIFSLVVFIPVKTLKAKIVSDH